MNRFRVRCMRRSGFAIFLASLLTLSPAISLAATNTGTGDVGGTALTDGTFDLTSTQLTLAKTAFLLQQVSLDVESHRNVLRLRVRDPRLEIGEPAKLIQAIIAHAPVRRRPSPA